MDFTNKSFFKDWRLQYKLPVNQQLLTFLYEQNASIERLATWKGHIYKKHFTSKKQWSGSSQNS